jgi:hypothetical protein
LLNADGIGTSGPDPLYIPIAVKDRTAIVQIYNGTSSPAGYPVPIADNVFPARYGYTCSTPPVSGDMASGTGYAVDMRGHQYLPNQSFYIGRFVGLSSSLPTFAISATPRVVKGVTTAQVLASDATFTIDTITAISGASPPVPLTVNQLFPVGYAYGQSVLVIETESGVWVNTPDSGKVRTSSSDLVPEYLWDSIVDHSSYNPTIHQQVMAEDVDIDGVNRRVKLFTAISGGGTGGGTGSGTTYGTGYCIEIEDLDIDKIHLNQITNDAGIRAVDIDTAKFQLWFHDLSAAVRQDAKWLSFTNYDSGTDQMWWHRGTGAFQFVNTTNYAAGSKQLLINYGDGTWKWVTVVEKQFLALDEAAPCELLVEDGNVKLKLKGDIVKSWVEVVSEDVELTCDLAGIVCGEESV